MTKSFTDRQFVGFSLRKKLFLLALLSFGVLIAVIVSQTRMQARDVADKAIENSLSQSETILRTRLHTKFLEMRDLAKTLAGDPRLLSAVLSAEIPTLEDLSDELKGAFTIDSLIITDAAGVILSRSDDSSQVGTKVRSGTLFGKPLSQGQFSQGFMLKGKKLKQMAVVPIRDNAAPEIVRGALALIYGLSDALIAEIKALTQSEVIVCAAPPKIDGQLRQTPTVLSYTNAELGELLTAHLESDSVRADSMGVHTSELELGGEEFAALWYPLRTASGVPVGAFLALRSRTELMRPFKVIESTVLLTGTACLLFACLLSSFLAGHIEKPIISLVRFAKNIQRGEYPSGTPPRRSDEVGLLYEAFFQMGESLKEKAVLEEYLANIAQADEFINAGWETELPLTTISEAQQPSKMTDALAIGEIFDGRYRIQSCIGEGGFSTVYLADDIQLSELVALKALKTSEFTAEKLEAFRQEIRLARRITHQNILRTHDFGVTEDLAYITMEYVKGITLAQFVHRNGPFPLSMGLMMGRQLCWAVDAAHEAGVIHRDLKPQNMIIDRKGVLKIMDFGIALSTGEQEIPDPGSLSQSQNRRMLVVPAGTPKYMSPEHFGGDAVDRRSDIYSAGVVLYFLFSGTYPFKEDDTVRLMYQHTEEMPPKLSSDAQGIPFVLDQIIDTALRKEPAERFQSMRELAEALSGVSAA